MNYLTSPAVVRIAFIVGIFFFVVCVVSFSYAISRFRRMSRDDSFEQTSTGALLSPDSLAFAAFQQTIRDLKTRQQEMESIARTERIRADAAAHLSRTLIDNLSIPALVLSTVGLVQQANPAARALFGYASLVGFNLKTLFDQAPEPEGDGGIPSVVVSDLIRYALQGGNPVTKIPADCKTRTRVPARVDVIVMPSEGGAGVLLLTLSSPDSEGACTDEVPATTQNLCCGTQEEG